MRVLKIDKSITKREQDSLGKYLHDIKKYPVLSAEEEVKLAVKILAGDQAALEHLVKSNLRFVVSVAKQYEGQGLNLPDLISEGNIGLIKAVKRFDHTKGFKFISFAVWWIRQSMIMAIGAQRRMIRLPMNQVNDIIEMRKAEEHLEQQLERLPTLDELADHTEIELSKLIEYQNSRLNTLSYDVPGSEDKPGMLSVLQDDSFDSPDTEMVRYGLKRDLYGFVQKLPSKQKKVLELVYGLNDDQPMHLEDIATVFQMNIETIRKYRSDALHTLRNNIQTQYIRHYL